METKVPKIYLTYYILFTAEGLWQVHYHTLSIIFQKEFMKLNVNIDPMIKNVLLAKFNTQTLRMI